MFIINVCDDIWYNVIDFCLNKKRCATSLRLVSCGFNNMVNKCLKFRVFALISSMNLPKYPVFDCLKAQAKKCWYKQKTGCDLWKLKKLIQKTIALKQCLIFVLSYIPESKSKNLFFKWAYLIESPSFLLNIDDYSFLFAYLLDPDEFDKRLSKLTPLMKQIPIQAKHCLNFGSNIISCLSDDEAIVRLKYYYSQLCQSRLIDGNADYFKIIIKLLSQDHRLVQDHYAFLKTQLEFEDHSDCWNLFWFVLSLVGFQNLTLNKTITKNQFCFSDPCYNLLLFYFPPTTIIQRSFYLSTLSLQISMFDIINLCLMNHEQFLWYKTINRNLRVTKVPPFLHLMKKSHYTVKEIPSYDKCFDSENIWYLYFLISKKTFWQRVYPNSDHDKILYPISPFLNQDQFHALSKISRDDYFNNSYESLWLMSFLTLKDFKKFITKKTKRGTEYEFICKSFNSINKLEN